MTFGDTLRRHRLQAGLSQEALAERAGLSARGLSDLERGARRAPYRATVLRLAEALGLSDTQRKEMLTDSRPRARHAASSPEPTSGSLPAYLTSFVGRECDLAEVRRLLATTRFLTLTGTGGIGKTRLALHAPAKLGGPYPDGVWLVELASLADAALVPQAVASSVGVRERPGRPLQQTLAEALRDRCLLLVLDNCEHLVEACAVVAEALLRTCLNLRILATSREVLRIPGETAWRVPPLGLPPVVPAAAGSPTGASGLLPLEQFEDSEAVRLFIARAAAVLPGFALTDRNATAVAHICQQLDGLPLAIELAAARVGVLGVEQLAARLTDRFRILTAGGRTALPRQQTLRATLDWSYALLSEPEQRLFERMSVFSGGWMLEAAEAVGAGDGIGATDVLELLAALVDKSVVMVQDALSGVARYRLLETLRQYARECLADRGQADGALRRHVAFFLALAERAEPELTGSEQEQWLRRLEQEHDNLRAALQWTVDCEQAELGLRLASAAWRFWWIRGHLSEGLRWLERLLAIAEQGGTLAATRAKALTAAGALATYQGDYSRATALLEGSLALFRTLKDKRGCALSLKHLGLAAAYQSDYNETARLWEESLLLSRFVGDKEGTAWSLDDLGHIATYQGDYERAEELLHESLVLRRELGDKRGVAWSLNNLARVARDQGDYHRASAFLEESLALRRELGDKRGIAWSLSDLGRVARDQGEYRRAAALSKESLWLYREIGDREGAAWALNNLGRVARDRGDYRRAEVLLEESLGLVRSLGDKRGIAECLEALASVTTQTGRAAQLLGAAQALREAIGVPLAPADRVSFEQSLAAARTRLGEDTFCAAWAAGRALAQVEAADGSRPADKPGRAPCSNVSAGNP